jgi:hypothetical protein
VTYEFRSQRLALDIFQLFVDVLGFEAFAGRFG